VTRVGARKPGSERVSKKEETMPKLRLVVENTFIDSAPSSTDLELTVSERVFNKLIRDKGPLGKVCHFI